jgi:hypothetical protein
MKHKAKRLKEGGGYGRFTEEKLDVEGKKEGLFAGKAAEDDSDTYAPKTRSFSETGPEKKKVKPKEPKASQDDAFPKKDRSASDTNNESSSYAPPRSKKQESTPDAYKPKEIPEFLKEKKSGDTPGKKYGIGPYGAFGGIEKAIREFKTPADRRYEEKTSKKMASGGKVSSASSRGDGIAQRGKTRGKMC